MTTKVVKIVDIHSDDGFYKNRENWIGKMGTFEPKWKDKNNFEAGLFTLPGEKFGTFFYSIKVEEMPEQDLPSPPTSINGEESQTFLREEFILKDSGEREKFESGMVRDTRKNKGRYDLISPIALRRLAIVYEKGAIKYEARNWEKGVPISRFMDSTLRHLNEYKEGYRDEDHLAQAAWNIFCMLHFEEIRKDLLDLPSYLGEKKES